MCSRFILTAQSAIWRARFNAADYEPQGIVDYLFNCCFC